ncbi:hypothetical protein ACW2QC_05035 [Virgibacillus sp. FSP13]
MSNKDILNLEEQFEQTMNEANKGDLQELLEEFKRNHFPNVLSKSAQFSGKIAG